MKQLVLSGFLLCSGLLFAQEKLIVEYQQMNEANPDIAREQERIFRQKFPNSSTTMNTTFLSYSILEFSDNKSNFRKKETLNNDQGSDGNVTFSINVGGQFNDLNSDLVNNNYKREVNLDSKKYIVNYPFINYQWKITDSVDTIKDYKVIKAIGLENGKEVEAWFAPELKVNIGPDLYNGLPGVILKLIRKLDNKLETTITYTAIEIDVNPKKISKLKPLKGEEITQEEFKKLQKESHEKMMQSFSSGVDKN